MHQQDVHSVSGYTASPQRSTPCACPHAVASQCLGSTGRPTDRQCPITSQHLPWLQHAAVYARTHAHTCTHTHTHTDTTGKPTLELHVHVHIHVHVHVSSNACSMRRAIKAFPVQIGPRHAHAVLPNQCGQWDAKEGPPLPATKLTVHTTHG